ncbi:hypothetical protein V9T40_000330 [Parthenolecanium corni]|uniref:Uncharacterized protein n=1 Tax=Parthenolecanium corni TaxID=536013 RepID=A0AAN9Y090_9HEMI
MCTSQSNDVSPESKKNDLLQEIMVLISQPDDTSGGLSAEAICEEMSAPLPKLTNDLGDMDESVTVQSSL